MRQAFIQKQHVTAFFFDLEKAYDTTWKYGISKDFHDTGLRGRLPLFIASFLSNRKFQVIVGKSYSKLSEYETDVPQGRILSVILFCLEINSVVKAFCPGVKCSLDADDLLISYHSKHVHIIVRHSDASISKVLMCNGAASVAHSKM